MARRADLGRFGQEVATVTLHCVTAVKINDRDVGQKGAMRHMTSSDAACPEWPPSTYSGNVGVVTWCGVVVDGEVLTYLRSGPLRERVHDIEARDVVLAEMRHEVIDELGEGLLKTLLASEPEPLGWEIGEALAETILEVWFASVWVWNHGRDRRTRYASLPGADLIGFVVDGEGVRLLFGEVKSSSDQDTPPNVLHGSSGMIRQLERLTETGRDHFTLIKWLLSRCITDEHRSLFQEAIRRYTRSQGRDLQLIGCLLRDTPTNEADLRARAAALADTVVAPTSVDLHGWYLPDPMSAWPGYAATVTPDD